MQEMRSCHGVVIIEDKEESMSVFYNGAWTGVFSTYSAISFKENNVFKIEMIDFECNKCTKMVA